MLSAIVNKGLRANFGLFAEMGATPHKDQRSNFITKIDAYKKARPLGKSGFVVECLNIEVSPSTTQLTLIHCIENYAGSVLCNAL